MVLCFIYIYSLHIAYVYTQTHREGNLLESLRPLHFFPTDSEVLVLFQAGMTPTDPLHTQMEQGLTQHTQGSLMSPQTANTE